MILKTEAIVLRTTPFGDNSLVTNVYTRNYGIRSFLVRAGSSKTSKNKKALFQPLQQIEIVFYQKAGRDLQYISETRLLSYYRHLDQDPEAITFACYLLEVFRNCLKEEEENESLFSFLQETLIYMDLHVGSRVPILLHFLMHFTRYLGFMPYISASPDAGSIYFDIESGKVEDNPFVSDAPSAIILQLLRSDRDHCVDIVIAPGLRREVMNRIMQYYRFHVEGFKEPGSVEVLEMVFRN
jgi:DNA repair protein RecO (recombination protein O)